MPRKQEQENARAEVAEVAPNILRMQLPIRMPGLGHVNCYALIDDKGGYAALAAHYHGLETGPRAFAFPCIALLPRPRESNIVHRIRPATGILPSAPC